MFKLQSTKSIQMFAGGALITLSLGVGLVLAQTQDRTTKSDKPQSENDRQLVGNAEAGRDVFRFETFGNEAFWTDAIQLPKGVMQAKFTPVEALKAGLQLDVEAMDQALRDTLIAELKTDHSAESAPVLNDPKTFLKLVEANAVVGVVSTGGKVGISCAICHAVTDESVYNMPGGGSVGRRLDGPAAANLDMGGLLALAANSRAYYPNLQLELGGKTIGLAPKGIRVDSTEQQVDAYLENKEFYPRGTFDETPDGIGNPVQNTPLFRQDLAAPYGSNGMHETFAGISNASFTTNLDLSTLSTEEGRQFLAKVVGENGQEMHENYGRILKETGVTGYPFVNADDGYEVGHRDTPVGKQVNAQKVADTRAYTFELQPPERSLTGAEAANQDDAALARSAALFKANCTQCHNADQSLPVPSRVIALKELWPAYAPVELAKRKQPLSSIVNSPGGYDDKMVVFDASERGAGRGIPLPLLLDLARKGKFLHDNSVEGLDSLLNPKRGADAPHPFFFDNADERLEMVSYLKGLRIEADNK